MTLAGLEESESVGGIVFIYVFTVNAGFSILRSRIRVMKVVMKLGSRKA